MIQFRKIYFYWYLLISLIANESHAQSINRSLNDVAMPSANATAFGKYGDIPVGHFTGVPNISIPITTIQEGSLSLPISLSYHASGIKVAELASWVGLGWNLNFGGQISRTIVGTADEKVGSNGMKGWLRGGSNWNYNRTFNSTQASAAQELQGKDTEPDIFSFTAGNYSGKFYFDSSGVPVVIPRQDLRVTYDSYDLNSFTVTTPDGTSYLYGRDEQNTALPPAYELVSFTGDTDSKQIWHLVKIIDFTRNYWIRFTYATESYKYPSLSSAQIQNMYSVPSIEDAISTGPINAGVSHTSELGLPNDNQGNIAHYSTIRVQQSQRLAEITTSSEHTNLVFQANTYREDLDYGDGGGLNPKRLGAILIKSSAGEQYTKKMTLNYDYLVDANCRNDNNPYYTKRLRLLSLQESSLDGTLALPAHQLEYEGDNNYPNRLSKAVDHWGFYNGKLENNAKPINTPIPLIPSACASPTFNRETNEAMMKKGSLVKITYPTGGTTQFEWEANQVKSKDSAMILLATAQTNISSSNCCETCSNITTPILLTAEELQSDQIRVRYKITQPNINECVASNFVIEVKLKNATTNQLIKEWSKTLTTDEHSYCKDISLKNVLLLQSALPTTGTAQYRFEVTTAHANGIVEVFRTQYASSHRKVGGLRVKTVYSKDQENAVPIIKRYDYADIDGFSSGILLMEPRYISISSEFNEKKIVGGNGDWADRLSSYFLDFNATSTSVTARNVTISDVSVVPLVDFNGYHIAYNRVTEIRPNAGKTVYEFFQEDPNGLSDYIYQRFPYPPAPTRVKTGLSKTTYQLDEQQLWVMSNRQDSVRIHYERVGSGLKATNYGVLRAGMMILSYPLVRPDFVRLVRSTEIKDGVTSVTENEYGHTEFSLPTKTKVTNSDNTQMELEYKYPIDFVHGSSNQNGNLDNPYNWMWRYFHLLTPIEIYRKINGTIVEGSKIEFSKDIFQNSQPLPNVVVATAYTPMPWKSYVWKQGTNPGWHQTGEIKEYWQNGALKRFKATGSTVEMEYTWNKGVLTQKKYGDLEWHFNYMQHNSRILTSVVNENGIKMSYEYDPLLRVKRVNGKLDANDNPVAWVETDYRYRGTNGFTQNEIVTTSHFANLNIGDIMITDHALTAQQYYDGLGRPTQAVKALMDGTFAKNFVSYDALGRQERAFQVFQEGNNDYAPLSEYAHYNYRNVKTIYEASPLSRPIQQIFENGTSVSTSYGANAANEVLLYRNGVCNNEYYPANEFSKPL